MIGEMVSHYRILEKIGEGGMSVVYRAEDTKLKRTVALKFLSPRALGSKDEKTRFLYEAQAAAALDHSNICTIHEIDDTGDTTFIAMAYVEGQNLRDRVETGRLDLMEALDIGVQIAEGLQAAHEKDIIHRDIKSANIMVTPKNEAKIMDFGLAKLPGRARVTTTGTTMGTVAYMSPEQARGEALDNRTDIWSMGVVLYEMVSGRLPFTGDYEQAVVYCILNEAHAPLSSICPGIPEELDGIMSRILSKRAEDRYQNVREFLADLRKLKRQTEIERHSTSKAWEFRRAGRRGIRRVSSTVAVVGLVAVVAALASVWLVNREWGGRPIPPAQSLRVTSGDVWHGQPAISPDGGRIAYVSHESGNSEIYVIDVRGGIPLRLTDNPAEDASPSWFPDGSNLVFVSNRGGEDGIWKVGQLGGSATLVLPNAGYPAISPDGEKIAFARAAPEGERRIGVASLADPTDARIITGEDQGLWKHDFPAWSPDGRDICYATHNNLWIIPASGGDARPLTSEGNQDSEPVWSPDGRYVYFSSYREGTVALWRVRSNGGEPERVSLGTGAESAPSISRDGTRLAYSTETVIHNLVIRDTQSGEEVRLPNLQDGDMPTLSPDGGKIVFASARWGTELDLWCQTLGPGLSQGKLDRLTDHPGHASHPKFSPDGKWIAYYRIIGDERDIWVIPSSGGQPVRFTDDPAADIHPAWSPDGSTLAFISQREEGAQIWLAPIEDGKPAGEPRRLTSGELTALAPVWSPDGRWIAFLGIHENQQEAWLVPADGSMSPQQLTTGADIMRLRWDPLTGGLLATGTWGGSYYTLRAVSTATGECIDVTPPVVLGSRMSSALFDVSKDGRLWIYSQEVLKGNIWVLEAEGGVY